MFCMFYLFYMDKPLLRRDLAMQTIISQSDIYHL